MPTEIRLIVTDDPVTAMEKFTKTQRGKYRFNGVEKSSFETVETHRAKQVQLDPKLTEVTMASPIDSLSLSTQTINALRHAQTRVFRGKGKDRVSDVVRSPEKDIETIGQLLQKSEDDLKTYFEIGPKRIAEIKTVLAHYEGFVLRETSKIPLPL